MATTYTVRSGDTLSAIAREHGFASWREIYFHEVNAEFRRSRPDPNRIYPGDQLIIPTQPSTTYAGDATQFRLLDADLRLTMDLGPGLGLPPSITLHSLAIPGPPILSPSVLSFYPGPRRSPALSVNRPFCAVPNRPTPPWFPEPQPRPATVGDLASAALKCPEVQQWLTRAGDEAYDLLWGTAPTWRRGLTLGVAVAGATGLLVVSDTRDPLLRMLPTLPIGRLAPSSPSFFDYVRPVSLEIMWEENNRGFIIHYDVQRLINSRRR